MTELSIITTKTGIYIKIPENGDIYKKRHQFSLEHTLGCYVEALRYTNPTHLDNTYFSTPIDALWRRTLFCTVSDEHRSTIYATRWNPAQWVIPRTEHNLLKNSKEWHTDREDFITQFNIAKDALTLVIPENERIDKTQHNLDMLEAFYNNLKKLDMAPTHLGFTGPLAQEKVKKHKLIFSLCEKQCDDTSFLKRTIQSKKTSIKSSAIAAMLTFSCIMTIGMMTMASSLLGFALLGVGLGAIATGARLSTWYATKKENAALNSLKNQHRNAVAEVFDTDLSEQDVTFINQKVKSDLQSSETETDPSRRIDDILSYSVSGILHAQKKAVSNAAKEATSEDALRNQNLSTGLKNK